MEINPYQPPEQEPSRLTREQLHPGRSCCPVCQKPVSRLWLFMLSNVKCAGCSTELALAMPKEDKTGLGCLLMVVLALAIAIAAVARAILGDPASFYWLLLLVPVFGCYGSWLRWTKTIPYPRSLMSGGRIVDGGDELSDIQASTVAKAPDSQPCQLPVVEDHSPKD